MSAAIVRKIKKQIELKYQNQTDNKGIDSFYILEDIIDTAFVDNKLSKMEHKILRNYSVILRGKIRT